MNLTFEELNFRDRLASGFMEVDRQGDLAYQTVVGYRLRTQDKEENLETLGFELVKGNDRRQFAARKGPVVARIKARQVEVLTEEPGFTPCFINNEGRIAGICQQGSGYFWVSDGGPPRRLPVESRLPTFTALRLLDLDCQGRFLACYYHKGRTGVFLFDPDRDELRNLGIYPGTTLCLRGRANSQGEVVVTTNFTDRDSANVHFIGPDGRTWMCSDSSAFDLSEEGRVAGAGVVLEERRAFARVWQSTGESLDLSSVIPGKSSRALRFTAAGLLCSYEAADWSHRYGFLRGL